MYTLGKAEKKKQKSNFSANLLLFLLSLLLVLPNSEMLNKVKLLLSFLLPLLLLLLILLLLRMLLLDKMNGYKSPNDIVPHHNTSVLHCSNRIKITTAIATERATAATKTITTNLDLTLNSWKFTLVMQPYSITKYI